MFIKLPIVNMKLVESNLIVNKNVFKFQTLTEESKEIVNTLINKGAYATALLYLNNNSNLISFNKRQLTNESYIQYLSECKDMLKECVKETSARQFKPLTQIGKLEIMESDKFIARGKGDKILIEDFRGYDYWGPKEGEPIEGECIIQFYNGPGNLQYLCKARNGKFVWRDSSRQDSEPYVFKTYEEAKKVMEELGGEILDYHKEYLGEECTGTQCSDIAEKKDQEVGGKMIRPKKLHKKLKEEFNYEEYEKREKERAKEGRAAVKKDITDEQRRKFAAIKEVINTENKDTNVDGWYFPQRALLMINGRPEFHMNRYYDLTEANILLDIDENNSIEEVIDAYFDEYKPDAAYSWAENFLYALDKADVDSDFAMYYEHYTFDVPKNHKFKGFMMNESGHYVRGNYILVNENGVIKAINKKHLKESYFNPGKYFKLLKDMENEVDMSDWNYASQSERDEIVKPFLEKFWDKYKEKINQADLKALFDDMEDSNYHTELNVLQDIIYGPRTYIVKNRTDSGDEEIKRFKSRDEADKLAQDLNSKDNNAFAYVTWTRK